jgi:hypothetical protein
MKSYKKYIASSLLAIPLLFSGLQVNAATAVTDPVTGKVTGLNSVSVAGFGLYDLTFNNLWTGHYFSSAFAVAASQSLLLDYTTGPEQGSPLDLNRTLVVGCEEVYNYTCQWFTPTADASSFGLNGESFVNYDFHSDSADRVLSQNGAYGINKLDYATLSYLNWTPSNNVSAVPVPAAVFMFVPALLGFMGLRRKVKNSLI